MTKDELVKFLEPFTGNVQIKVKAEYPDHSHKAYDIVAAEYQLLRGEGSVALIIEE